MPSPSPPSPPPTTHIPLPYRLFHLYIEPLLMLPGGIYLSLFQPRLYLLSTMASPISAAYRLSPPSSSPSSLPSSFFEPEPITPLIEQLLINTAALYILFMVNELLVLRLSKDILVWRAVILAMLCCDLGHLYGMWIAGGGAEFMLDPVGRWSMEDWVNMGILAVGAVLRSCFLVGVGLREGKGEDGEREKRE